MTITPETATWPRASAVALPVAGALSALAIAQAVPLLGPLLVALLLGAVTANTPWGSRLTGHAAVTRTMLRWGVVLLGLRISGTDLLEIGVAGVVVVVATVSLTFTSTRWLGRRLGLEDDLVTLVAAGFSICGAAAIAAVDDAVRAKEKHVGLAVALVTLFGSLMIVVLPLLSTALGLDDHQAAVWAGASIHEVAQVIAAASLLGGGAAVAVAATVKLGRVLLLAPVYVAVARTTSNPDHAHPFVPWFVVGFAAAVVVRSSGVLPDGALEVADLVTTTLLAAAMFGLGLGIRAREIWPVPAAALVLATISTCVAAGSSLLLVLLLVR